MTDVIVILLVIAIATVLFAVWQRRRGAIFSIEVEDGRVVRWRGQVPQEYFKDVEAICKLWAISRGTVRAFHGSRRLRIEVGGGIEQRHRQAFQNAWVYPV